MQCARVGKNVPFMSCQRCCCFSQPTLKILRFLLYRMWHENTGYITDCTLYKSILGYKSQSFYFDLTIMPTCFCLLYPEEWGFQLQNLLNLPFPGKEKKKALGWDLLWGCSKIIINYCPKYERLLILFFVNYFGFCKLLKIFSELQEHWHN